MRFEPRQSMKLAAVKMVAAGALAGILVTGCDRVRDMRGVSDADARATAKEAYIAAFPLVTHYAAMYAQNIDTASPAFKGPLNVILAEPARLPSPTDVGTNRANGDVIISTLQADLRAEPLVLCVPAIPNERFYSMQFVDMNMYNFGSVDNSKNSGAPGCVMMVGPDFGGQIPTGVKQIMRSSTQFARVIYRLQVESPLDIDVAAKLQSGFTLQTLTAFVGAGQAAPLPVEPVKWRPVTAAAFDADFAPMADFLLQFTPAADEDQAQRFARIGIGAGKTRAFEALPAATRDAALAGFKDGAAAIAARAKALETRVNGWRVDAALGDRASFSGDVLKRAAAVATQPFGPNPVDLIFVPTDTDANGQPLDGAARRYTLTFPAGLLPPVEAFWSLSIYDARTGGLVANPIERYRITSAMVGNMVPDANGATTLYLGSQPPGDVRDANWLPAPAGPFSLVLRMYRPTTVAPSILPAGNGSWRPPAVTAAQ